MRKLVVAAFCLALGLPMAAEARDRPGVPAEAATADDGTRRADAGGTHRVQRGKASFYGRELRGRRMANGRRFDPASRSAANRTLPLGTRARVTNLENGRSGTVVIEDRGPRPRDRVIDVSPRTAGERA